MARHVFDAAAFRAQFPQFADETQYPAAVLAGYFNMAGTFVSRWDNCLLYGERLQMLLELVTAHIVSLLMAPPPGQVDPNAPPGSTVPAMGGILQAASIDKVSVSIMAPPVRDGYDYWFNQTPYGQQYLALLSAMTAGGIFIGGMPESMGFRRVYGRIR